MMQGLSWWQAMFVLASWALVPAAGGQFNDKFGGGFVGAILAGGIGGAIGGGAATLCSNLARRPANAGLKFLAMLCITALAYGGFYAVAELVSSELPTKPDSAAPSSPAQLNPADAAPTATQTWVYNPTAPIVLPWTREPVNLDPPTIFHATGAELHWSAVDSKDSTATDGPVDLEVYRGTQADFTPSPATLIAKLDASASSYTDTTAPAPTSSNMDAYYYYMIAVRTQDGDLITGNVQFAQLPESGHTEVAEPANVAATLNSAYPDSPHPGLSGINPGLQGSGAQRAIFAFGPLSAVPTGAHISSIHLDLACNGSVPGGIKLYALTRSFDQEATWNSAMSGIAWSHPGGDYTGPAADSVDTPGLCEWDVTSIVHNWTADPNSEHGLLLRFTDESSSSPFGSFNDGSMTPGHEPQLLVTYTPGG